MTDAKPDESDAADKQPETTDKPTLDQLLESWDQSDDKADKGESKDDIALLKQQIASLSYKAERDKMVTKVKGDLPVSDDFAETWMNMQAEKDERLLKLWDNRDSNRKAFDAAMEELGKDFQKFVKASMPEQPSDDDKGLAAAARMARETKSSGDGVYDTDWGSLGDSDFGFKKAEVFRLAKAGKLK